jgi:hypothetical protein
VWTWMLVPLVPRSGVRGLDQGLRDVLGGTGVMNHARASLTLSGSTPPKSAHTPAVDESIPRGGHADVVAESERDSPGLVRAPKEAEAAGFYEQSERAKRANNGYSLCPRTSDST